MIFSSKAPLREKYKALRATFDPHERSLRAVSIYRHFLSYFSLKNIKLAGYVPLPDEIDILLLLHHATKNNGTGLLPRIITLDAPLVFSPYFEKDLLVPGLQWKIPEPSSDKIPLIPDIMLVPLLAFNDEGYRLGYGSGLYDRTIAYYRKTHYTLAVGIGYSEMRTTLLPTEIHDSPLDIIITESGPIFCGGALSNKK